MGDPPHKPCSTPSNPCQPSPCGPNTECHIINGFHRCTCKSGYLGNPNTIRGCKQPANPCIPNPCGPNALCDPKKASVCSCRPGLIGDPYAGCRGKSFHFMKKSRKNLKFIFVLEILLNLILQNSRTLS